MNNAPSDDAWDAKNWKPSAETQRKYNAGERAKFARARWAWTRTPRAQAGIALAFIPMILAAGTLIVAIPPQFAIVVLYLVLFYQYLADQASHGLFTLRQPVLDEFQRILRAQVQQTAYWLLALSGALAFGVGAISDSDPLHGAVLYGFFILTFYGPRALGCWKLSRIEKAALRK